MMERSPLPPQAGNTRLSYNDRGAYWESSGRRNEKMMIGGRANSMSPPQGVSSKMAEDFCPPPHQYFTISAWPLQQSDFRLDALRSKADSPQRHLFKWRKRSIPTHSEWLYPLTFDAGKGLKEA